MNLVGDSASQTIVVAAASLNRLSGDSAPQTIVVAASSTNRKSGDSAPQTIVVASAVVVGATGAPRYAIRIGDTVALSNGQAVPLIG